MVINLSDCVDWFVHPQTCAGVVSAIVFYQVGADNRMLYTSSRAAGRCAGCQCVERTQNSLPLTALPEPNQMHCRQSGV
ncbi:hypothetical protein D3C71_1432680 [compost metagenome]